MQSAVVVYFERIVPFMEKSCRFTISRFTSIGYLSMCKDFNNFHFLTFSCRKGTVEIGFAESKPVEPEEPIKLLASLSSIGKVTHYTKGTSDTKPHFSFRATDVIGCGWSKKEKSVFFTKNGELLGICYHISSLSISHVSRKF